MFDLAGRSALVTGASGGIGGAIARALASQGAVVAVSGTRASVLEALAAEIGGGAVALPADLRQPGGAEGLVETAVTQLGAVDILVHNAGMTRDGLALRMSDEDWAAVIELNLSVGFRLMRSGLRGMMKKRWGRIIGITSVVAVTGNPGQANYAASKAGMIGMMKAVAQEVGSRGITANCVAPGFIDTEMTASTPQARREALIQSIPLARLGLPEDVAGAVAFLASDAAAYITGQTLHVNGGLAMV